MKHLFLPLLLLSTVSLWAQSFYLNFTDGTQAAYNISDVRKITFTGNLMNLNKTDGTVYSWDVNTIEDCKIDETSAITGPKGNTLTPVKIFPNPTSGAIEVTYAIETEAQVTLEVSDMQGRILSQKQLGNKPAGTYTAQWDVNDSDCGFTAQGTYLCRIITPKLQMSRSFIIR
jgi:hypothetical protein